MPEPLTSPESFEPAVYDTAAVTPQDVAAALSAARLGAWRYDFATGRVTVSTQVAPMLGLPLTTRSLPRSEWVALIDAFDRPRVESAWLDAINGKGAYQVEYRVPSQDGRAVRWLASCGIVVRNAGTATHIVGVCRDITDEKRNQKELARSTRRFGALADATADLVWVTDADGAVVLGQELWKEFTGQTEEQYRGWGWLDAVHPDDRVETVRSWQDCLQAAAPCEMKQRLRRHDGAWRDMSLRAVPVIEEGGSVEEWVGVHTDRTEKIIAAQEQEQARRDAETSLTQLEAVLQSAHDGIIISDPVGNLLMWNPAALAMHDYTGTDEVNKPLSAFADVFAFENEDGMAIPFEAWPLSRLIRGEVFTDYEVQLLRPATGTRWWASYSGNLVRGKDGQVILLLLTVRDVSERRRMQLQRDSLLRRIEEATQRQRRFLREMLSSMTEGRLRLCDSGADLPPRLSSQPFAGPTTLLRGTIRNLRRQVDAACETVRISLDRQNDLVTAVGEAAMNAVVHAGEGIGNVYTDSATGRVQVWITDQGHGINEENLHRATLEKGFSSVGTLGHGFWMMLKTADRVYLMTGSHGTTVVMEQDREPPLPAWLQTNQY